MHPGYACAFVQYAFEYMSCSDSTCSAVLHSPELVLSKGVRIASAASLQYLVMHVSDLTGGTVIRPQFGMTIG